MRQNLENIKKGLIYLKDKDYIKAEIFFLNLVRKNPSDVQIYSYLIPVLIEQKNDRTNRRPLCRTACRMSRFSLS